jgi:hypothetical protein
MAIDVQWSQEHSDVLLMTFQGTWSWQDYYASGEYARTLIAMHPSPVHIIYDLQPSTANVNSPVLHLRHFAAHLPQNARLGLHVYIGASTFWRACITAFSRVYPSIAPDIVYVSDYDSAWVAIDRKREQIDLLAGDEDEVMV